MAHQICMIPSLATRWIRVTTPRGRSVVFFSPSVDTPKISFAPVQTEGVHCFRKFVEYNRVLMPVVEENGKELKVPNTAFMTEADAYIAVTSRYVRRHVQRSRKRSAI